MNTFQLVCFLTIAEHLSFTKAAELLHVTQPAVGQQIQSLEKELGVKLFTRTTRSVKLTKEGKSFLGDAAQIVNISERAKKRFASTSSKEIGTGLTAISTSLSFSNSSTLSATTLVKSNDSVI